MCSYDFSMKICHKYKESYFYDLLLIGLVVSGLKRVVNHPSNKNIELRISFAWGARHETIDDVVRRALVAYLKAWADILQLIVSLRAR